VTEPATEGAAPDGRREQMLEAALDVIAERGFANTRIADVASRAGTSAALVIYYFKARDLLLAEAIRLSEDRWYAEGMRRMAATPTAAGRLEELIAMSCVPDLWAQSARNDQVAMVRAEFDDHWRRTIADLVREGQRSEEFHPLDAEDFAVTLSALIDGFAIQIALEDGSVDNQRAFQLTMQFAAERLGFDWAPHRRRPAGAGRAADRARTTT